MIRSSHLARWAVALLVVLAGSASVPAVDLYVTGWDTNAQKNVFGKIDSATGVYSQLQADMGTGFDSVTGLAWNPNINKFNTLTQQGVLNTITTTGTLGSQIASGLSFNNAIAYNTNSSKMYEIGNSALGILNTTSGAETSIGGTGTSTRNGAAFVNGTLYGTAETGSYPTSSFHFGSYNLSSGAFTAITGNDSNYNDMRLASDGTNLFGLEGGFNGYTLYSINPLTGAYTSPVSVTGAPTFNAMSMIPVAVPEPSTYALAAIATGVMAGIARRRKARQG